MRQLIRKIIVWALGFEPYASDEWKCFVEGEARITTLKVDKYGWPPRIIKRPIVVAKECREGDMPEMAEIEYLTPLTHDFESKTVIYRKVDL